jgi:hypothetical protein
MLANTSPLVILLLGVIIGWLLEWFFDLWFFRRDRLEAQRRLESVEAQLAAAESRAKVAETLAAGLEQQISQTTVALAVADAARNGDAEDALVEPEEPDSEELAAVAVAEVIEDDTAVNDVVSEDVVNDAAEDAAPVSADAWPPGAAPADAPEAPADPEATETEVASEDNTIEVEDNAAETVVLEDEEVDAAAARLKDPEIVAAPIDPGAWPPEEK